jgi:hypothetical protein
MALHELATNAVKYSALSNGKGQVRVEWKVVQNDQASRVTLSWQEIGGPAVVAAREKGFGSVLIERALKAELGVARLDFNPQGLSCTIEIKTACVVVSAVAVGGYRDSRLVHYLFCDVRFFLRASGRPSVGVDRRPRVKLRKAHHEQMFSGSPPTPDIAWQFWRPNGVTRPLARGLLHGSQLARPHSGR